MRFSGVIAPFLTSALGGSKCSSSHTGRNIPGEGFTVPIAWENG